MIGFLNHWGGLAGAVLLSTGVGMLAYAVWPSVCGLAARLLRGRPVEPVEAAPLVGVVRVPQPWHPSQRPMRVEPVTELLPRICDRPDATVFIPWQRAGERRG
ncbi:hypothetical protein [Micromonospora sediminicola]|uniref:hypothetical protein n=1 Tax=Micromonospora sediminicola TaxID=946078 RepID=UPI00378E8E4E